MSHAPRIIFSNGKGGTGKTTCSYHAILGLAHNGLKVGFVDTDWQKTLTKALAIQAPSEPGIAEFKGNPEAFDVVIIDSPPRLDERPFLRELADCDLCVIVTQPSLADLWGTQESARQLATLAPGKKTALLLNGLKPGRIFSREFPALLKQAGVDIPMLDNGGQPFAFHDRECYKHSFGGGWAALDDAGQLGATLLANSILAAAKA
jgi:cellulose biosynthesis protein BcsQ